MIDRRAFIGAVGAACVVGVRMEAKKLQRLGMQLYTVRTEMEKDVDATLARVAALGYKEVEFAGYFKRQGAWVLVDYYYPRSLLFFDRTAGLLALVSA